MLKSISRNSDLDLDETRFLKMVNGFEGALEYIQHDYDRLKFIPSADYLIVEGTSLPNWELPDPATAVDVTETGSVLGVMPDATDTEPARLTMLKTPGSSVTA